MDTIPNLSEPESSRSNTTGRQDWSGVAVRLLQGVVYQDDHAIAWETLLNSHAELKNYFATIGLSVIVDEVNAMAYLRQNDEPIEGTAETSLPRLFRRQPLSYEQTLLCVLLREELRQFEENDVQNERCIVQQGDLLSVWQAFFPESSDTVKLNRTLNSTLRKLEELRFVKQFEKDPPSWEVCRILKARLPLEELENLRKNLLAEVSKKQMRQSFDRPSLSPWSHEE
jgi:hypothetical protein